MILEIAAFISLALPALATGLFLANLLVYRRLPGGSRREQAAPSPAIPDLNSKRSEARPPDAGSHRLSVLIPARNEEQNLPTTLAAVLANTGADFEVLVLDDHSTDRTAEIVQAFASRDPRLRLHTAPALPTGWCGKPHACHMLAGLAKNPLLVFLDADVRLAPDALRRMAAFMATTPAALASGVPRQELGTFSERLLIPLIHSVLLGYLPMFWARRSTWPAFAAGCGQLFIARADAYRQSGGHAAIRATLHDGIKLPRAFRLAGFRTELFDPTDVAVCRMYHTNAEVWSGLGRNATEGIAAPATILPMTVLLCGGQVLPWLLLATAPWLTATAFTVALAAAGLSLLPRWLSVIRFRQPLSSALLHPLGVLALLGIQWAALIRHCRGQPSVWKGRAYAHTPGPVAAATTPAVLTEAMIPRA